MSLYERLLTIYKADIIAHLINEECHDSQTAEVVYAAMLKDLSDENKQIVTDATDLDINKAPKGEDSNIVAAALAIENMALRILIVKVGAHFSTKGLEIESAMSQYLCDETMLKYNLKAFYDAHFNGETVSIEMQYALNDNCEIAIHVAGTKHTFSL
tara:strand:+ start:2531 stop:3001 length:471 start_codon:yes stop_codon:yes gene_type:complete